MKQILIILSVLIVFISCNREDDDIPDYLPGRITEVSHEAYSDLGLVYHKYEYSGENVTDLYCYSSPKIFISKYRFNNKQLKEIHFSFENTSNEYDFTDSIKYIYSDSLVVENYYFSYGEVHKEFYGLKNGKIISSSWNLPNKFIEFYYEWKGDNLIRIVNEFWLQTRSTPIITEYVYEYSDIENPFYFSNIPRIMKEFTNPHNIFDELTDLIPKCSKNFPLKLTVIKDGPTIFREFSFECKTFLYANKPFEVKMTQTRTSGFEIQHDYYLTYEEL